MIAAAGGRCEMVIRAAMTARSLGQLLAGLAGESMDPVLDSLPVGGVALDSRLLQPGDVFLAYPGAHSDGRDYVREAVGRGACAIISEGPLPVPVDVPVVILPGLRRLAGVIAGRWHGEPAAQMRLIGVTGTNGKTTCTRLLAQILRAAGRRCGSIGTLGASLDDSWSAGGLTTPDPVALHAQLAAWRDADVDDVVMEVSSHALDQERVSGCTFQVAVFTNLSRDHLDYHGTMDDYIAAKARLFSLPGLRTAVINRDDPVAGRLLNRCAEGVDVIDFSVSGESARWRCRALRMDDSGTQLSLDSPLGALELRSPLLGGFNAANLMAVLATLHALQPQLDAVALTALVAELKPVPGRMQQLSGRPRVIIDYAHTPDALAQSLSALRQHCSGQLWCVFGCGGDRDRGKRGEMGRIAEEGADQVVITSDNPRSEAPEAIAADILAGTSGRPRVELDRARAIEQVVRAAAPEDWVLLAGKGHEQYQLVAGQRLPFSDVAIARAALDQRGAP